MAGNNGHQDQRTDPFTKTLIKTNVNSLENEELRIVYVGITRPKRLLMIGVPDSQNKDAWGEYLGLLEKGSG